MNPISKFNTHYNAFKKALDAAAQAKDEAHKKKKAIQDKNNTIYLVRKFFSMMTLIQFQK